jgi:hypothetical protein
LEVVESARCIETSTSHSATKIVAKFKNLRRTLKRWGLGLMAKGLD